VRGPVTAFAGDGLTPFSLWLGAVFAKLLRQVAATKAPTGRRTPNQDTSCQISDFAGDCALFSSILPRMLRGLPLRFEGLPPMLEVLPRRFEGLPRMLEVLPRMFGGLPRMFGGSPRMFEGLPPMFEDSQRMFCALRRRAQGIWRAVAERSGDTACCCVGFVLFVEWCA
jgi:hypothetical protein